MNDIPNEHKPIAIGAEVVPGGRRFAILSYIGLYSVPGIDAAAGARVRLSVTAILDELNTPADDSVSTSSGYETLSQEARDVAQFRASCLHRYFM